MKSLFLALLFSTFFLSVQANECVALLHGLARSDNSMAKMGRFLEGHDYQVINISYESTQHPINELSDSAINEALDKSQALNCDSLHFVTHSMGGILVRDYLSKKKIENLGRVVMFGPPNKGSEVVDKIGDWRLFKWINGPAGQELGTDSLSTPNALGKVDFELGIIAGDRSINWINSLMIDGSDDGKVSVEHSKIEGMKDHIVLHTTHPMMMKNKEALNQMLYFLENGMFDSTE